MSIHCHKSYQGVKSYLRSKNIVKMLIYKACFPPMGEIYVQIYALIFKYKISFFNYIFLFPVCLYMPLTIEMDTSSSFVLPKESHLLILIYDSYFTFHCLFSQHETPPRPHIKIHHWYRENRDT